MAVGLCLVGAPSATAQSLEVDCTTGPVFTPNPYFCLGVHYYVPDGACGCAPNRLWGTTCSGGTITGTSIGGVNGCYLVNACSIVETPLDCSTQNQQPPREMPCPDCPPKPESPPPPLGGAPVVFTTGEMFLTHTDGSAGTLAFSRTYNTVRTLPGRYGAFGPGWNSTFDKRLNIISGGIVEHRDGTGYATYFQDATGASSFRQELPFGKDAALERTALGYRIVRRSGAVEDYSSTGALISETDAAGVTTTYSRDPEGRVTSMTRKGRSLMLTYAGLDPHPMELKGPTGERLATYTYEAGVLVAVDYAENTGYRYVYGAGGIVEVNHADGTPSEAHEYYPDGRTKTSEVRDGIGKITMTYGPNQTTVTDALGRQTVWDFVFVKHMLRTKRITSPCSACTDGSVEIQEWTYDEDTGDVTSMKDAAGKVWIYEHDPLTLDLTKVTDPMGNVTTYTYDDHGRVLSVVGPASSTTYTQSGAGPTSITVSASPGPRTTSIQYFAAEDARKGSIQTITDPRQKVTAMGYDQGTGDLTAITDPLGHTVTIAYDEMPSPPGRGLPTSATDALGHLTKTTYDGRSRVNGVIAHDGSTTSFTYDRASRRQAVVDPMGRTTRYVYDEYGRLMAVVDPAGKSTSYTYDVMGNLLSLQDAKGQTTTFEYENHDRVKKMIYPGGGFETFAYDSRGRMVTMLDRKGNTTTLVYDDLGRLTEKSFTIADGSTVATPAFHYTYDGEGRMLTASNGSDTLTWTYNPGGDLASEQSATNSSLVAYQYDDGGNRVEVKLDGSVFVTYAYDDASRLETITRGGNPFTFGYDNANRRTSMSYPNGITTGYEYDSVNRLTLIAATNPLGIPVAGFGYGYDPSGNRIQKNTLEHTEAYKYDLLYRLTRADRTNPDQTPSDQGLWSYDAVGNRTSAQDDAHTTTSFYNQKNQLTSTAGGGNTLWRGTLDEPGVVDLTSATVNGQPARMLPGNVFEANLDLPAGPNTVTIKARDGSGNESTKTYSVNVTGGASEYTYDLNGNLKTKTEGSDVWVYEWNALNQLVEVKKGTSAGSATTVATFKYDPIGRRIEKSTPGKVTTYTYDGADILRENVTTSGTVTSYYVHGPGVDEPLAKETDGVLRYYHADGLGSVVKETDGSGVVVNTLRYDAWGNIEAGARDGYAFTGREWDPETGWYYYRARFYDPRGGRFVSEDPIGLDGGPNAFSYVDSGPVNFSDPSGKCPWCIGAAWGLGIELATQLIANGGSFRCLDWKGLATATALGAVGGGLTGKGVGKALASLSRKWNPVKGAIGEGLSLAENWLKGATLLERNEATIAGFSTKVDSTWRSLGGTTYFVESKFGLSTLTKPQRLANAALGPSGLYRVERWGYPFFERVGAHIGGSAFGAAATAGQGSHSPCACR